MRVIDLREDPSLDIPRPEPGDEPLEAVRAIIDRVRREGDGALIELTERFDGVRLDDLRVPPEDVEEAAASAPLSLTEAMHEAAARIRAFAERQALRPWRAEVGGGTIGENVYPVPRAGIYVPGGLAAYPSSVLMCGVPAQVAGVPEVVLCTPPSADGTVAGAILAAAHVAGIDRVYRVGGAQAIAAMAFGTETIPRVDAIVGPGNVYVALAKREVAGLVQIDSIAGPSEIAVVAGPGSDPEVLAADLIAQAEHGPHGSFLLVTWDDGLVPAVEEALAARLDRIGASADLRRALAEGCSAILVAGPEQGIEAVNRFGPEHLELIFDGAAEAADRVTGAGAIFLGPWSPVSLGDYLAGTSHVLPTGGAARWSSGLRTSHFQKTSAVILHARVSLERALPLVRAFAGHEGLPNHARALEARLGEDGSRP